MDKTKLARFAVKAAIGALGSVAIGSLIKAEKSAGLRVDEYFAKLKPSEN